MNKYKTQQTHQFFNPGAITTMYWLVQRIAHIFQHAHTTGDFIQAQLLSASPYL